MNTAIEVSGKFASNYDYNFMAAYTACQENGFPLLRISVLFLD